jgi:hypothetical protein
MDPMNTSRQRTRCAIVLALGLAVVATSGAAQPEASPTDGAPPAYPWNYRGTLDRPARTNLIAGSCPSTMPTNRVLLAGDSWAQFMWDDDAHNQIFDKFGHADKLAVSRSLGSNPGPGYEGPEYAVSGSEAREWVDTANFPWIANVVTELEAHPTIDTILFSLGGNDVLAGRSDGGWYKDMDLDVPGSEEALFARILADSDTIVQSFAAVLPDLDILVSSYEYPNFNVDPLWCWIYACPKREDLSRDPVNDLITDQELNALNLEVESRRIAWTNGDPRLLFDHGVGEMHHYYGDGVAPPGDLPRPGQRAPDYEPFPGGNPAAPTLRENFRRVFGIDADPIHLDEEGYRYKVSVQAETTFFSRFRGPVTATLRSEGGMRDGWTNSAAIGTDAIVMGDDGIRLYYGLASFDTSGLPDDAEILSASLYLLQDSHSGTNPFTSGDLGAPRLDVRTGTFNAPEVEVDDWNAPADALNAGCFVGSAASEYYALRIDLTPEGLAALNRAGTTQFRLAFSDVDAGIDRVDFHDGDAAVAPEAEIRRTLTWVERRRPDGAVESRLNLGEVLVHRGVAEILGSAQPFLDVRYGGPIFGDGFESGDTSAWDVSVP